MRQFEGIPGPAPSYPLGTLSELMGATPWEVLAEYGKKYGGMSLAWIGGRPTVLLNDPHLIREVLVEKTEDYYKDYPIPAFRPVLRNTIFNMNGSEWKGFRKAHPCMFEGFRRWLPTQFSVVKKVAERHLNELLRADAQIEPVDKMQRIFFDVYNACAVGPDFEDGGFDNFYIMTEMATFRMKMPQFMLLPPLSPRYHRATKLHYGAFEKAVHKARRNPDPQANDLLHVFLRYGTDLSDSQLVDFMSEFHAGGDISSAAAMTNTFHLLNGHPHIARRLYADLGEMVRQKPDFDLESLEKVPLLDHVLRESLRMIPPVPIFSRLVRKDRSTTLGGRTIPPNTEVMVLMKHVQNSPDHWRNPDEFNPDRWAQGGVEANPIGSDYFFPFGRGPRMCTGAEIAIFCMKIILGTILSRAAVATSGDFRGVFHCGVVEAKHLKARLVPHAASPN